MIDGVVNQCVFMQQTVREKCVPYRQLAHRFNYVTPTTYLELLNLYCNLLEKRRTELMAQRTRTATGLEKLLAATKEVEVLQLDLEAMQPLLIQASQETEFTMKQIVIDKDQAEKIREVIVNEELVASKKANETKSIAEDARRDLDEALPALDAALDSLKVNYFIFLLNHARS